jgi:hypothetical protein
MRCYGISFSLLEMSLYVQKESQSKPSILQHMFDMDFILISFCQTLQNIGSNFQLQCICYVVKTYVEKLFNGLKS